LFCHDYDGKITGPNAGGPRQFPIRTPPTARVGQFWRSPAEAVEMPGWALDVPGDLRDEDGDLLDDVGEVIG
jgi:hypothetical protein